MRPRGVAGTLVVWLGFVDEWHVRWRAVWLDSLADPAKSGALGKADEGYWQRVGELLEQEPSVFGDDFTVWTGEQKPVLN